MRRKSLYVILIFSLLLSGVLSFTKISTKVTAQAPNSVNLPTTTRPEVGDFSTMAFGNAWDMDAFSDISQYLNGAGRHPTLTNISVANGIFSARSIGDSTRNLANFYLLFPGHAGFMQIGNNLGSLQPIDSRRYDCAYLAMKVNSPPYVLNGPQPDIFRVVWYEGQKMGVAFDRLYPETVVSPFNPPVHSWRLYKIDLANPKYPVPNTENWRDRATWSGIEINPTIYSNVDFQVDWVRFTSCSSESENRASINWSPNAAITTIWARPVGTNRNIQLVTGINGSNSSYQLSTNGLAPGSYQIGLGTLNNCCIQWSSDVLDINQTPIAKVIYPSSTSGKDYASTGGNPWNMDPTDIAGVNCSAYSFEDGALNLETLYPAALPSSCKGPVLGEADSRVYMNMPASLLNARNYRYLSFKLHMEGSLAVPADGMIGRLMWETPNGCTQVTADIPYDVGWNTYQIDLHDPFNGTPVQAMPSGCPIVPWSQTGQVVRVRFDPNENWTGNLVPAMIFYQKIDWISLTEIERIAQGLPYSIGVTLNKPLDQLSDLQYYYTTDPRYPHQNRALIFNVQTSPPLIADNFVYLPGIFFQRASPFADPVVDAEFSWDTSSVEPGTYYICVKAIDSMNESSFCSDAPVEVYAH